MKCRRCDRDIVALDLRAEAYGGVGTSGLRRVGFWGHTPRALVGDKGITCGFGYFKAFTDFSYVVWCNAEMLGELHTLLQREAYECYCKM